MINLRTELTSCQLCFIMLVRNFYIGGDTMTDEELYYMDTYYKDWLISSYSYHFGDGSDVTMGDTFWDGLARLYVKCLSRYPYLKSINFDGSTMGVKVDKNDLKREIENPEILTYIYK